VNYLFKITKLFELFWYDIVFLN